MSAYYTIFTPTRASGKFIKLLYFMVFTNHPQVSSIFQIPKSTPNTPSSHTPTDRNCHRRASHHPTAVPGLILSSATKFAQPSRGSGGRRPRNLGSVHRHSNATAHQRASSPRKRTQKRTQEPIQRLQKLLPIHKLSPFSYFYHPSHP